MEHNEIRHRLSEYIDGSVTAEEKKEMEAHLRTCSACNDAFSELQKTIECIKTVEEVQTPAWMTQKSMAKVRFEETKKKSLFQKLFFPSLMKKPIQTAAVLFVAVCAFYIYRSIEYPSRTREMPADRFSTGQHDASPELSSSDRAQDGLHEKEYSSLPSQKIPQIPAYKSLDMKPEYAAPSPPVNGDEETALASDKTKRAKQAAPGGESMLMEKIAPAPPAEVRQRSPALAEETKASAKEPASDGSSASSVETDAELIKKVGDYFSIHHLPRNGNGKAVKYDVSKFQDIPENASWLDTGMQKKMTSCKNTYLVDVLISQTKQKYVYCADNVSIELLFKVAQKNGRWIKTE
jgi:hypothetical protein